MDGVAGRAHPRGMRADEVSSAPGGSNAVELRMTGECHSSGRPWRFLVYDDGPDVMLLWTLLLRHRWRDADVASAVDAHDVVERIREQAPDLLLTGGQQPSLSGYEMTALLRAQGFTAPIIICTASPPPGAAELACSSGADAILLKAGGSTLETVIDKLLGTDRRGLSFIAFDCHPAS